MKGKNNDTKGAAWDPARKMLGNIASVSRILDAGTVITGMRPSVAITIIELGLSLEGVMTALNVERGIVLLRKRVSASSAGA